MGRDKLDELITDVYRAKLVYEAEMKSPEYRAKGEEDFEFIGKALAAKGYCKASDVAREIFEEIESIMAYFPINGHTNTAILNENDFAELKKRYTEGEG